MTTTQRNASTQHTVLLNVAKDTYYSLNDGVMKPLPRPQALALIADTAAMIQSGNIVRFAVNGTVG